VCVTDVDGSIYPLGGNMRLKALQELKLKEIPSTYVMMADEWTEERRREFVIKDNVGFGEWDWEQLANDWDTEQLNEWGLDVPEFATEVDYSILDDEDVEDQLADMTNGVKKAIQIEFEAEHYEEAYALVKFWREQNAYVGGMIMEYLKEEKNKI
jgi:ParB-like chromosome segregation protein Spo0J